MAITKRVFSGSSGGRGVAIATGLTTIHTTVSGTSDYDEVFLYVTNLATVSKAVTVYVGATLAQDTVRQTIAARDGLFLVGPGMPLGLGKLMRALATGGATNLVAHGWVNRIEQ